MFDGTSTILLFSCFTVSASSFRSIQIEISFTHSTLLYLVLLCFYFSFSILSQRKLNRFKNYWFLLQFNKINRKKKLKIKCNDVLKIKKKINERNEKLNAIFIDKTVVGGFLTIDPKWMDFRCLFNWLITNRYPVRSQWNVNNNWSEFHRF